VVSLALGFTTVVRTQQAPSPGAPAGSSAAGPGGRGAGPAPAPAAPLDPGAVARGRALFLDQCTACHGVDGRGAVQGGFDLSTSPIVAGDAGTVSFPEFLKTGRPERRMPPFAFADAVVEDLFTFLKSVRAEAVAAGRGRGGPMALVVGDPKAGEAYFNGAGGCTACHSPTGDLKGIGARLPVAAIVGKIVLPRGSGGYPPSYKSPPNPDDPPRTVTVTPVSGPAATGTLLFVTDFEVTLRDAAGVRRTFARNGDVPKVEIKDPIQWHIDKMPTLTDKDMHDLTAFLVTLR
jgi:cytochrome c oxidase cbb3-type subunit III